MKYNLIFILGPKDVADSSITVDVTGQMQTTTDANGQKLKTVLETRLGENALQNPRAVRLKVDEVHDLLVQLEKQFV
jgi:threonyl-tRNA synthetase